MRWLYFFIVVLLVSCNSDSGSKFEIGADERKIVIEHPQNYDSLISTRDLLKEVSYISLDTDSFVLGKPRKILEFNDRILVHDQMKKVLAIYDFDGHFKGLVGNKGDGPNEQKGVTDFDIDYDTETLVIYSRGDLSFLVYDHNFTLKKKVRIDLWAFQMSFLENGLLAFYSSFEQSLDNKNISIFDLDGKKMNALMEFPRSGSYVPFDYSGFLKGNFYTYPLSSIIYKIDTDSRTSQEFINIDFPGERDESKRFSQTEYLGKEWMQTQILSEFTIGSEMKEMLFFYSIDVSNIHTYSLGVKLKSGQIFSHANMKHSSKKYSDAFSIFFFLGPYSIPDYSKKTDFYYGSTTSNAMYWYATSDDKNKILDEVKTIDPELAKVLSKTTDQSENTILIKFKLKDTYE